jgi:hypothetical protein
MQLHNDLCWNIRFVSTRYRGAPWRTIPWISFGWSFYVKKVKYRYKYDNTWKILLLRWNYEKFTYNEGVRRNILHLVTFSDSVVAVAARGRERRGGLGGAGSGDHPLRRRLGGEGGGAVCRSARTIWPTDVSCQVSSLKYSLQSKISVDTFILI